MVKIDGKPRLCKLMMWPDFDGYGFNLHAEKSRPGQYVGKVDEGSPAEAAGLREGDRIIEVNGFNISSENHKQVVSRIKSIANETDLLVVDKETDKMYRESGLVISSEDAVVISSSREEIEMEDDPLESNGSSIDKVKRKAPPKPDLRPRLCRVVRHPKDTKFGFTLLTDKRSDTQHIGNVYPGTPAYRAGVRPHDRIIEVNGFNVEYAEHKEIVAKVNKSGKKVDLLVVDNRTYEHFQKQEIKVHGAMQNIIICTERNLANEEDSALYIPTTGKIRSCHIIKTEPNESFGFSIQTVKKENTKFIKEITPHGPADRAGLLLDDVVLAVNGDNVIEENHKSVVDRIISRELDTTLLVTDRETFAYCMEHQIPLSHPHLARYDSSKGVSNMTEEGRSSNSSGTSTTIEAMIESPRIVVEEFHEQHSSVHVVEENNRQITSVIVQDDVDDSNITIVHANPSLTRADEIMSTKEIYVDEEIEGHQENQEEEHTMGSTGNSPSPRSTPSPQFSNHTSEIPSAISPDNGDDATDYDDLNLNMTAAEMRERISAKKKRDPRKDDRMDILRKYEIVQTL